MVAVAVLKRTTMNVVQDSACNCELTKTPLCEPSGHAMEKKAAENYVIKFETTQGDFEVEVLFKPFVVNDIGCIFRGVTIS